MKRVLLRLLTYSQAEALKTALSGILYYSGVAWLLSRARRPGACILLYHSVGDDGAFWDNRVSRARFEHQLRYLARTRTVVPMSRLVDVLHRGERVPADWVVITFDDGYRDNLMVAAPSLNARRLPASFYVTVGVLDGTRRFYYDDVQALVERTGRSRVSFTWNDIRFEHDLSTPRGKQDAILRMVLTTRTAPEEERQAFVACLHRALSDVELRPTGAQLYLGRQDLRQFAAGGFEVGSHTVKHSSLAHLPDAELAQELTESRARLEHDARAAITGLAYPFGKETNVDGRVRNAARAAGYRYALTTRPGHIRGGEDPFDLPRIGVRDAGIVRLKLSLMGVFL